MEYSQTVTDEVKAMLNRGIVPAFIPAVLYAHNKHLGLGVVAQMVEDIERELEDKRFEAWVEEEHRKVRAAEELRRVTSSEGYVSVDDVNGNVVS